MIVPINIPDAVAPQVIDTFARAHGWRSVAQDGDQGAFAKAALIESIMATLRQQRAQAAAQAAYEAEVAFVNSNVVIS